MTAKKKAKGFKPVLASAQQRINTQKQIRHLRKKKPVSVAQQRVNHAHQVFLQRKAKAAKAHHHAKAKTHGAPLVADGIPSPVQRRRSRRRSVSRQERPWTSWRCITRLAAPSTRERRSWTLSEARKGSKWTCGASRPPGQL